MIYRIARTRVNEEPVVNRCETGMLMKCRGRPKSHPLVFKIDSNYKPGKEIIAKDAVFLRPHSFADGRRIDGEAIVAFAVKSRKSQVYIIHGMDWNTTLSRSLKPTRFAS